MHRRNRLAPIEAYLTLLCTAGLLYLLYVVAFCATGIPW